MTSDGEQAPRPGFLGAGTGSALTSMLTWDVRLQVRYGLYAVYAVLTVVFVLGITALGPALRTDAAILLIVTDPAVLGFYFIAAMVLFEKREGVLDAVVVSPLGKRGYLVSKVLTLSTLATVAATAVAVLSHGRPPRMGLLIIGVGLSASLFVLIGFVAVARYSTINEYFISAVGWGSVLFLPLAGYLGLVETPLFYLLPAQPVLVVVEAGFRQVPQLELLYAFGYLLIANVVAYRAASIAFRRYVVRGGGGRRLENPPSPGQRRTRARGVFADSPWTGMLSTDLRNWVRDPMLCLAALGPLVLAVCIRYSFPTIASLAAPVVDLSRYSPVIVGAMAVFGPEIFGFVIGMFILQDREQGVLAAYRTSPLSARGYVLYRGGTAYVLSFVATLAALAVIGLVPASTALLVATAAVGALGGPLIAFVFGSLASNTIEGLALSKVVNIAVIGPAVAIAVLPEPAEFIAALVPTYWPIKSFVAGVAGSPGLSLFLAVGSGVNLLAIAVVSHVFIARAD